jgi:quinol monooxygenase YgiN
MGFAVLIRFNLGAETRRRAVQAMLDVAPLMIGVDGLQSIDVLEDAADPLHPAFYEVWESRAAWETFNGNRPPQIAAQTATIASCFAGPPDISTFEILERH